MLQTDENCAYTFTGHHERVQNKITERLNRQAILDEKMKKFLAVRFKNLWIKRMSICDACLRIGCLTEATHLALDDHAHTMSFFSFYRLYIFCIILR